MTILLVPIKFFHIQKGSQEKYPNPSAMSADINRQIVTVAHTIKYVEKYWTVMGQVLFFPH